MAKRSALSITAEEAEKALRYLVHEGKVTARAVEKALARRERLIREIRDRMAALGVEAVGFGVRTGRRAAKAARRIEKETRKPRRRAVSAATRSARQAQGQYMAAVRRLSKDVRKEIKAIRAKSGVKAAIAAAKKLAK